MLSPHPACVIRLQFFKKINALLSRVCWIFVTLVMRIIEQNLVLDKDNPIKYKIQVLHGNFIY